MNPNLLNVAISNIPTLVALLHESFRKAQPNDPQPTDAEMLDALASAVASSIAKDDQWLANHPDGGAA
jgi:hypothetical protein